MKTPHGIHSLKWRILVAYSLILIVGGLSTSMIGVHVTGQALLAQARRQAARDLATARFIFRSRIDELRRGAKLLADDGRFRQATEPGALVPENLDRDLERLRLDFIAIADSTGRVVFRAAKTGATGDMVGDAGPVARALTGEAVASVELLTLERLEAENPALVERVASEPTEDEAPGRDAGMCCLAAAPITGSDGAIHGALYVGVLLNGPRDRAEAVGAYRIIDDIEETLYPRGSTVLDNVGNITITQNDVSITTDPAAADGRRGAPQRIPDAVREAVIARGETWTDRVCDEGEWWVAAYESITDMAGQRIGVLGLRLREAPYSAVRNRVILIFGGIALLCFGLIVVVTYFLTNGLMRPLDEIVEASHQIAAGNLSHRVKTRDKSEFGVLSESFNTMLDRLQELDSQRYSLLEQDAEQWTQVLEERVRERTKQLAQTQAALNRQQRLASLGQLAAGVAHEINNPLGGILTFASLVLEELPPDSQMRGDVDEIIAQADRCRKIVRELLEFSRQREGHAAARDINDVVARSLKMLEKQASFQDIEIVREFGENMPHAIADESQMQQVFINIIINAVQAMDERGKLTITTGHNSETNEVFVRISDTGPGIPKEIRESIFDPFFTTKDPGKGTGLGLAVVCQIVQSHQGRLELDSKVGEGTNFTVVLPVAAD